MSATTTIRVALQTQEAQRELNRLKSSFGRAGSEIDNVFGGRLQGRIGDVTSKLSGLRAVFSTTAGAVAGLTAAVGAAAVGLGVLGVQSARATSEIVTQQTRLAERLGVSIELFSSLSAEARLFGADAEDVSDVLGDLTQKAVNNEKDFQNFGIAVRDANGQLLDSEQILRNFADRLAAATTQTEAFAIADDLASDAGRRLLPILIQGSAAIDELTQRAAENNKQITGAAQAINQDYIRAWARVTTGFEAATRELGTAFMPMLTAVANILNATLVPLFNDLARATSVVFGVRDRNGLKEALQEVRQEAEDVFGELRRVEEMASRAFGQARFGERGALMGVGGPAFQSSLGDLRRTPERSAGRGRAAQPSGPTVRVRDLGRFGLQQSGSITFGQVEDAPRAPTFAERLSGDLEQARTVIQSKGEGVLKGLGEIGAAGVETFAGFGGAIAGAFAEALQGGDFGEALKRAIGQSITMLGMQLMQAGIASLLLAPLAFIPFFGKLFGAPGQLAAAGAALTAGGAAMIGVGSALGGGSATGGQRPPPSSGGSPSRVPAPGRTTVPQFGPEFGGGLGRQPAVVNVTFNAPVDRRGVRRELQDILGGG